MIDIRLTDKLAAATPANLETVITQVFSFSDGSRLTVKVDAPAGAIGDLATAAYYRRLLEALDRIEAERLINFACSDRLHLYLTLHPRPPAPLH